MLPFITLRTPRSATRKAVPTLETLESRLAPYAVTGNAWPASQLITISFVPDGTVVSNNGANSVGSNLFSTFNTKFGSAAAWENIILKAAQAWAQQTNINFALVSDNGTAKGGGSYQQGDPGMGDIRISGYNFGNTNLGLANAPAPANNYSAAGDVAFNTGQTFNNGSTYDLFTVAAHEIGHALGLDHSTLTRAVMYSSYNGVKTSLASDDVSGIRNIYSGNNPRAYDAYYGAATPNSSFASAADVSSSIDLVALTATLTGLDITTTTEAEYFQFSAPTSTTGTLTVNVQSSGLSLLAPKMTVYAADQTTVLGSANGAGQYGTTLSVSLAGVTPGQRFYVKVQGADASAFGTGAYAMTLNFGSGASPAVPLPSTTLLNGTSLHAGGGLPDAGGDSDSVGGADMFPAGDVSSGSGTALATGRPSAGAMPSGNGSGVSFAVVNSLGTPQSSPITVAPSAALPAPFQNTAEAGFFNFGGGARPGLSFGSAVNTGGSTQAENEMPAEPMLSREEMSDRAVVPAAPQGEGRAVPPPAAHESVWSPEAAVLAQEDAQGSALPEGIALLTEGQTHHWFEVAVMAVFVAGYTGRAILPAQAAIDPDALARRRFSL